MSSKKLKVVSTEDLPAQAPGSKRRRSPGSDCAGSRRRPKMKTETEAAVPDPPPPDPPKK